MDVLSRYAEKITRSIGKSFLSFHYREYLIVALAGCSWEEIYIFSNSLMSAMKKEKPDWEIYMGLSSNKEGIAEQGENFDKALTAMSISLVKKEVVFYDKLDIYKLLAAVKDRGVLYDYYHGTIGLIENYDLENHTNLTEFLHTYLENNESPQIVSEKLFIHRNTVSNLVRKIEKITGLDPRDAEDKVKLYMGYYVKDMIQER